MATKPLSPTPEKMENTAPQQIDAEVMELVKRKGKPEQPPEVEKAKAELLKVIKDQNIDPMLLIRAGQIAEAALSDPTMYPMAVEVAIREGLIAPEDVGSEGVNYKLLANGITAGMMVKELMDEGRL
jgi:hypothetical protein